MTRLHYKSQLKSVARKLRSDQTPAEHKLWMYLRRRQILGVQFLRQKPLGDCVVDFCALSAGLVIEVNGGQHFEESAEARDAARDRYLTEEGFRVPRFTNTQVLKETADVLAMIHQALADRLNPPQPPFYKGGSKENPQRDALAPIEKGGRAEGAGRFPERGDAQ